MEQLVFYNVKKKNRFSSSNYTVEQRGARTFAVAKDDDGTRAFRIMPKQKRM